MEHRLDSVLDQVDDLFPALIPDPLEGVEFPDPTDDDNLYDPDDGDYPWQEDYPFEDFEPLVPEPEFDDVLTDNGWMQVENECPAWWY